MKLIGSKTEREFRNNLIVSSNQHFSEDSNSPLKCFLQSKNIPYKNAHILNEITDESTTHYSILISGSSVLSVEIDKSNSRNSTIQSNSELKSYLLGLSKIEQIKLFVAKELSGM